MIEVNIKKLADIDLPAYQTDGAAAMDLVAAVSEEIVLPPHTPVLIPSGIAIELPSREYVALLFARSGLGCKYGIALANGASFKADYPEYAAAMFFLCSIPPAIGLFLSVIPLKNYALSNKEHSRILAELQERRHGK